MLQNIDNDKFIIDKSNCLLIYLKYIEIDDNSCFGKVMSGAANSDNKEIL